MNIYSNKYKLILNSMLVVIACSSNNVVLAEEADQISGHEAHHAQTAQTNAEWPGIYNGFIPCDDCNGIKTSLALNSNNTYILIRQYVGKSEREIVEKGKYTTGNSGDILVLTPRNTVETGIHYFRVGESSLIQLDNNGNAITGKKADRFVLRKNEIKEPKAASHAH